MSLLLVLRLRDLSALYPDLADVQSYGSHQIRMEQQGLIIVDQSRKKLQYRFLDLFLRRPPPMIRLLAHQPVSPRENSVVIVLITKIR